jgi:hypothetical protein
MVAAVLPLVGLAMFGPSRLLSSIGRRRRLLQMFGLGLLVVASLSCTSTAAGIPNQSPVAAITPSTQASPSPSPSTSPTC